MFLNKMDRYCLKYYVSQDVNLINVFFGSIFKKMKILKRNVVKYPVLGSSPIAVMLLLSAHGLVHIVTLQRKHATTVCELACKPEARVE